MNKRIAFLTTIYTMDENYILDFFNSLNNQTFKEFDLIVVNDKYENFDLIIEKYTDLNIIELVYSSTPLKNREYGINYIINNNYDIVVFGDSDDYFSINRVEVSIEKLLNYDIVINDLTLFKNNSIYNEKYISNRLDNNSEIGIDYIKEKNIFGMSNTALKVESLDKIIFDSELIALDWYIFSLLLLKSKKAIFTNETQTFYRQHSENTIGIGQTLDELIRKGILVKMQQYSLMKRHDSCYNDLYEEIKELDSKIKAGHNIEKYIVQNIKNPLWWEEIKMKKEKNENKIN